ncbi:MAG: oligosaccharide flippase family protein [Solirubrobacteraceae bacterium]|nr:oligosaccharide flippase family protein [Patulibacter sp.]
MARNTALRASAEVLGKIATLALTIVMGRELGTVAVGEFGFALAVSQLYWPIAGFGLDRLMLRAIAVDHTATAKFVPQLNAFKLTVGLLCTVVGTAAVAYLGKGSTVVWVTLLLSLTLVATLIGATAQSVFMAHERTQDFFVAALPVKVVSSFLGIAVLLAGGGLIAVGVTSLIAAVAGIVIGFVLLGRKYDQPPAGLAGTPRTWWPLARAAGPWGLQEVFGQITFRVGIIVLYVSAGATATGDYRYAYQLLEATLFLAWSIGTSILPLVARTQRGVSKDGEPPLESVTSGAIELVVVLMLPIAVMLSLCAHPLLTLLFDQDGVRAATFLPFLAIASVVYGIGHIAGIVALTHLPGRKTVETMAIAAGFSLIAVLILVPAHAARGTAIAALCTETVLAGLSLRLAIQAAGPSIIKGIVSIGLIAGAAMVAVVLPLRDNLWLSAIAGGLTYAVVLLALEYRRRGPAWDLFRSIAPGSR